MAKTQSKQTRSRTEKLLAATKLDPKSRAYGMACIAGEKQAELYLHELRLEPDLIGMPLMGRYVSNIRPLPKDPRISGLLVGFFGRVEQAYARSVMDDIWQRASWGQKWEFVRKLSETREVS